MQKQQWGSQHTISFKRTPMPPATNTNTPQCCGGSQHHSSASSCSGHQTSNTSANAGGNILISPNTQLRMLQGDGRWGAVQYRVKGREALLGLPNTLCPGKLEGPQPQLDLLQVHRTPGNTRYHWPSPASEPQPLQAIYAAKQFIASHKGQWDHWQRTFQQSSEAHTRVTFTPSLSAPTGLKWASIITCKSWHTVKLLVKQTTLLHGKDLPLFVFSWLKKNANM